MHAGADPVLERMMAQINSCAFIPPPTKGEAKMPKPVTLKKNKEFVFKQLKGGGGESKYAWDEWFNGDLLMLERSTMEPDGDKVNDKGEPVLKVAERGKKDYEVETNFMPAKINAAARKRYKIVQISRLDPDGNRLKDALIIKARDMTPEERQAEDELRAEEAAAKAVKKAAAESNGQPATPAPAEGAPTA